MGFRLSIFSKKRRAFHRRTVNDKEPLIHMLPVEILQYISDTFLPLDAAASFTLCSRSMLRILGNEAFRSLSLECHTIEKTRFLKNWEKDLPDWLFCHHCSKLHPVNQIRDPGQYPHTSGEPECAQVNGFVSIEYDINIRYDYAQFIMRDYRLGRPYMLYLERLSKRSAKHLPDTSLESVHTVDIVGGELLIHTKHTLRLFRDWDVSSIRMKFPAFCSHLMDRWNDSVFAQTLRCRLSHANRLPCIECAKLKHCRSCPTSFKLDVRTLETLVTEVRVDVWRCLGPCESPFSSKWHAQAQRHQPRIMQRKRNNQNTDREICSNCWSYKDDDEDREDITENRNGNEVLIRTPARRNNVVDIHLFI